MARALHGVNVGGSLSFLAEKYKIGKKGDEILNALGKHKEDFTPEELKKYKEYCINDTELCYTLFCIFSKEFPRSELSVINLTLKMFIEPILELDADELSSYLNELSEKRQEYLTNSNVSIEQLRSDNKYAELLKALEVDPPRKISKRTQKEAWAFSKTDQEHLALLEHPNFKVQSLVSARLGTKSTIEESRAQRFLNIAERGLFPVPLKYYAAHTGRWGGDDKVNIQNLPSRGQSSALKDSIFAPMGYSLIDADSSQIEARILAYIAGQNDLVEAFSLGKDIYKEMAAKIYKVPIDKVTKEQRQVGKTTILGCGYGMGANKFQVQLKASTGIDLPIEECEGIIRTYRSTMKEVVKLWHHAHDDLVMIEARVPKKVAGRIPICVEKNGFLLPNGLVQQYNGLSSAIVNSRTEYTYSGRRGERIHIYGGKVVENLIQALARCVIAWQMVEISKRYRICLTVHDSLLCLVKDEQVEEAKEYITKIMKTPPSYFPGLPLNCEVKTGKYYGGCK
jgi:DNA polymerase